MCVTTWTLRFPTLQGISRNDARHYEPSLKNTFLLREDKSPNSGPCSWPTGLWNKASSFAMKGCTTCNCFGAQKARQGSWQMIHHCQCSTSGGWTLPSTLPEQAHRFQFLLLIIARHHGVHLIAWDLGSTLTAPWHLAKLTGNSSLKGIIKAHRTQQAAE